MHTIDNMKTSFTKMKIQTVYKIKTPFKKYNIINLMVNIENK
jgi:hypothetical protein